MKSGWYYITVSDVPHEVMHHSSEDLEGTRVLAELPNLSAVRRYIEHEIGDIDHVGRTSVEGALTACIRGKEVYCLYSSSES